MAEQEKYRLQKYLSRAGVTSRRKAEDLIREGRVKVNGVVVTELGFKVTPGRSKVLVDSKPVFWSPERTYLLLNKPSGYITSLDDPEKRPVVVDLLPRSLPRVFPVGRLDWDSEGLLLLTDDGELAHLLTHPSHRVPRVYAVKVRGLLGEDAPALAQLKAGVELDDEVVKPDRVAVQGDTGKHTWLEIELHSGKNRVVRRLCEAVGHPVLRLRRVQFGSVALDGLKPAAFRNLAADEVVSLYELAGAQAGTGGAASRSELSDEDLCRRLDGIEIGEVGADGGLDGPR